VKKLVLLLIMVMLVAVVAGCGSSAGWSTSRNVQYLGDDTQRALGFDHPSGLHSRDNIPWDTASPYRPYD
jgi:uncharacterized lipoprotein